MQRDQFNQFFKTIKFIITCPDEDCKLCYSSDGNCHINSNRKCSNFDDAAFNCCFISPDILSIHLVFIVKELALKK